MNPHPRYKHFPQHLAYTELANEYKPHIMFVHTANYRSEYVNTNEYGLRDQYDASGNYISLKEIKDKYPTCNVIVGGSTVFGVDATSDKHTIAYHLNKDNEPCINFGIRGANSRQELLIFMQFLSLLPKIKNVVILSGLNNLSLCSLNGTFQHPNYGSVFSESMFQEVFIRSLVPNFDVNSQKRGMFYKKLEDAFTYGKGFKASVIKYLVKGLSKNLRPNAIRSNLSFNEKLDIVLSSFENDILIWSHLSKSMGFNTIFALQPVVGWNKKELNRVERECIDEDRKISNSYDHYSGTDFYLKYKSDLQKILSAKGYDLVDANNWIDEGLSGETVFTDICHLTDKGNQIVANKLKTYLK